MDEPTLPGLAPMTCWKAKSMGGPVTRFTRTRGLEQGEPYTPDIAIVCEMKVMPAGNDGKRLKMLDDEGRLWIKSLISTPDIDSDDEIINWDAFEESMPLFAERPRMLAHHRMDHPIGNWPIQNVDKNGTTLEGFISSARPDIQQLTIDGVLDSSVGFRATAFDFDEDLEVLHIVKARLWEGSLVTFPANEAVWVEVLTQNARSWARDTAGEGEAAPVEETPEPETVAETEPGRASIVTLPGLDECVHDMARTVGQLGSALDGLAAKEARRLEA